MLFLILLATVFSVKSTGEKCGCGFKKSKEKRCKLLNLKIRNNATKIRTWKTLDTLVFDLYIECTCITYHILFGFDSILFPFHSINTMHTNIYMRFFVYRMQYNKWIHIFYTYLTWIYKVYAKRLSPSFTRCMHRLLALIHFSALYSNAHMPSKRFIRFVQIQ